MTQPPDPIDESSRESFPASDPPSWEPLHSGAPMGSARRSDNWRARLKGILGGVLGLVVIVLVSRAEYERRAQYWGPSTIEHDWSYVLGGGDEQQLNIQTPPTRGFATVVFVHGGSLVSGDKNDAPYQRICANIVLKGVGCARVNYRLAPAAKWPAQPRDVAAAFSWVLRNIAVRGGDSTRVFLWGHSSGCLIASIVAADPQYTALYRLSQRSIAGLIAMGCTLDPYDTAGRGMSPPQVQAAFDADRDEQKAYASLSDRIAANPYLYVNAMLPRTLIMIADSERFQPPILEQAEKFQAKARAAGTEPEIVILPGRRHQEALDRMADPKDSTLAVLLNFISHFPVDRMRANGDVAMTDDCVAHPDKADQSFAMCAVDVRPTLRDGWPAPRYPFTLMTPGIAGRADFVFQLDTVGRLNMSRFTVTTASDTLFAQAIRRVAPFWRFTPARRHGRAVPVRFGAHVDFLMPPRESLLVGEPISELSFRGDSLFGVFGVRGGMRDSTVAPLSAAESREVQIEALRVGLHSVRTRPRLCVGLRVPNAWEDPSASELEEIAEAGVLMLPHSACRDSTPGDSWMKPRDSAYVPPDSSRIWPRGEAGEPQRWNADEAIVTIEVWEANSSTSTRCRVRREAAGWTSARCTGIRTKLS